MCAARPDAVHNSSARKIPGPVATTSLALRLGIGVLAANARVIDAAAHRNRSLQKNPSDIEDSDTMSFTPTPEQSAAVSAFTTGDNLVIEAGAGTGKTSTLRQLADVDPSRRGLYLAFNKSVQVEAENKFAGTNVTAMTANALAYKDFGRPMRHKLDRGSQMRSAQRAEILGIKLPLLAKAPGETFGVRVPKHVAVRLVSETLKNFCRSNAGVLTPDLVPIPPTMMMSDAETADAQEQLVKFAQRYWDDVRDPNGILPYQHDFYMKQWAMSNPRIDADYILFDEAQDADALVSSVVQAQTGTQIVAVGDKNQAIYRWRGAIDAMDAFGGKRYQLTKSFRFGHAIAEEANVWLDLLNADLRIQGSDKPSSVWESKNRIPEAILCRTNAGAIAEVIYSHRLGVPVAIGGKNRAKQMRALAEACQSLMKDGWTRHPDLDMFTSWEAVQEYVEEDDGAELAPLVKLVDRHGAANLITAIDNCVPSNRARTVIATAHVAKGMEWKHVRISDDFYIPGRTDDGEIEKLDTAEAMLAYVSITRAMRHLDPGGLAWVRDYKRSLARPEIGIEWRRRFMDVRREARDDYVA